MAPYPKRGTVSKPNVVPRRAGLRWVNRPPNPSTTTWLRPSLDRPAKLIQNPYRCLGQSRSLHGINKHISGTDLLGLRDHRVERLVFFAWTCASQALGTRERFPDSAFGVQRVLFRLVYMDEFPQSDHLFCSGARLEWERTFWLGKMRKFLVRNCKRQNRGQMEG